MIWTIARLTLVRLRRGRALWAAVAIALLPAAAAVVLSSHVHSASERAEMITALYVPQLLVLSVLPALLVASSIGEEIEDRTITYLWSRPLPRWHVIAGKLVALAPVSVAFAVGGWLLAVKIGCDWTAPGWTVVGIGSAALALSAVSAGIATLAPKHGMALTIIYMLLFDLPIGEIPASLQALSVTHQARELAGIAAHGIHPVLSRTAPAVTMAVLAGIWLAVALWKIGRTEA